MTDKQKSLVALNLVKETCDAALDSIAGADGIVPDDLAELKDSEFSTIHKDFLGLLAYLYSATTKTALSLKPSSPTFSASLTPLKDLSDNIARLASNVRVVRTAHGATVLKEMQSSAQSVVAAVHGLARALISDLSSPNEPGEEYLPKVGEVHHAIDRIRGSGGLSSNNVAAAYKIWTTDQDCLADALSELQEMAESKNKGDDDFDDGWGELGVESSQSLVGEELERLKKIESIIKLSNLLHRTVAKKVLQFQPEVNPIVDALAKDSATLPAAVDDLISTVYSPQDTEEMVKQLHHIDAVLAEIQSHLTSLFALEPVGKVLKESVDAGKKSADVTKWFGTCFDEIKKLTSRMSTSLQDTQ